MRRPRPGRHKQRTSSPQRASAYRFARGRPWVLIHLGAPTIAFSATDKDDESGLTAPRTLGRCPNGVARRHGMPSVLRLLEKGVGLRVSRRAACCDGGADPYARLLTCQPRARAVDTQGGRCRQARRGAGAVSGLCVRRTCMATSAEDAHVRRWATWRTKPWTARTEQPIGLRRKAAVLLGKC